MRSRSRYLASIDIDEVLLPLNASESLLGLLRRLDGPAVTHFSFLHVIMVLKADDYSFMTVPEALAKAHHLIDLSNVRSILQSNPT